MQSAPAMKYFLHHNNELKGRADSATNFFFASAQAVKG